MDYATVDGATYSETVTINPVAATISEVGSISLPSSTASTVFNTTREIIITTLPPVFPNPPVITTNIVLGNLTLGLNLNSDNFAFTTGLLPLTWNGSSYAFAGSLTLSSSLGVSYSLVTGGDTYAGTEQLPVSLFLNYGSSLDLSQYPTTIGLNPGLSLNLGDPGSYGVLGIANFTASNGFEEDLFDIVPEPSTTALLVLGMTTACIYWRRR